MGHVPDGVFRITGRLIEILSAPTTSVAELTRLSEILTRAQARSTSSEEMAAQVAREAPSFGPLFELLPRTRSELYSFISMILAAVALVLSAGKRQASRPEITIQQVIEQTYAQTAAPVRAKAVTSRAAAAPGRNDPCPCGSGKKYKKCHGAPR
jgi:preprotein translocase subunit SecA